MGVGVVALVAPGELDISDEILQFIYNVGVDTRGVHNKNTF